MKRVAFLVAALLTAPNVARAGEIWAVGSVAKSVKIVDTGSEAVVATVPLFQGEQARPARGIAFSTVDGLVGAFAFVGQGSTLQVVDANSRSLARSVDLGATLGLPLTIVDLESSPNRAFAADGGPAVRAYLVVVADAVREAGSPPEAFWIVLDQRALVQSPAPVAAVVASGFLHASDVPAAERGQAAGVSVMGSPHGASFFRAWVTTRVSIPPAKMRATLLEKGARLDAPWLVGRSAERVLPQGRRAPESFSVATPHDGEAQIFPAGATGALVDLGHGGSCLMPSANFGAVAVRGPAAGGYEIVAVDLDAEELLRVNESTCAFQRTALGSGPADVTVDALSEHGAAWVANRDSDDLTVVRLDGSSAQVPLGSGPAQPCAECPESVEARIGPGRGCTTDLRIAKTPPGVTLSWDAVGCTGVSYAVYCQCDRRLDATCDCACDPLTTPGCFGSLPVEGQPGVQLGFPGLFGPLTRQFPPDPPQYPLPFPPEPVIQLGNTPNTIFEDDGGGGGVVITRP